MRTYEEIKAALNPITEYGIKDNFREEVIKLLEQIAENTKKV